MNGVAAFFTPNLEAPNFVEVLDGRLELEDCLSEADDMVLGAAAAAVVAEGAGD